jgi:hypothetical protein
MLGAASLAAGLLLLAQSGGSNPGEPPGSQSGLYIEIPFRRGTVYVPLDASGQPLLPAFPGADPYGVPGAPRAPAAPPAPPSPSAPAAPPGVGAPLPVALGFLRTEVEPRGARVIVDGRDVGTAEEYAEGRGAVAMAPGPRRVEIVHPGFKPLRTTIEVAARQTYTLRWRLERE